jgi:NTP pyrophosphatase (non-canonical NTP hydrolase)
LGVVEEVGELAHANLKEKQGIRGTTEEHIEAEKDAVGDILIYLTGYCSYRGWDMLELFEQTAEQVMKRDWLADPSKGEATTVNTRLRNSPDQDPNYKKLPN